MRIFKEGKQLSLFDWANSDKAKPYIGSKSNTANPSTPSVIPSKEDTRKEVWFNDKFLKEKFKEFDETFFENKLEPLNIDIKIKALQNGTHGQCSQRYNIVTDEIKPTSITINKNLDFPTRFDVESTLIHEMCHAYQSAVLCHGLYSLYKRDCESSKGTHGHGDLFFEAADLVNKSSENKEGYNVTQYSDKSLTYQRKVKNAKGWLSIGFNIDLMFLTWFSDTEKGRTALANYSGDHPVYAYKNEEVKSKVMSRTKTRGSAVYLTFAPILLFFTEMIDNGDLIPIYNRPETANISAFKFMIIKYKLNGKEQEFFISLKEPIDLDTILEKYKKAFSENKATDVYYAIIQPSDKLKEGLKYLPLEKNRVTTIEDPKWFDKLISTSGSSLSDWKELNMTRECLIRKKHNELLKKKRSLNTMCKDGTVKKDIFISEDNEEDTELEKKIKEIEEIPNFVGISKVTDDYIDFSIE